MWDVSDPWTPYRSLWQEVLFLRADRRVDAQVVWVRGHSEMWARAQASCWVKYASAGNAAAHARAQEAATWHPCPANLATSLHRTAQFSGYVLGWFARILEWSIGQDLLPKIAPLPNIFGKLRPPVLPAHCVAVSGDGVVRRIRCLLPEGLLHGGQCRPAGTRSHTIWALSEGVS